MQLKDYQTRVLERFDLYLKTLDQKMRRANKILELDQEDNPDAKLGDYPRDAWDELNREGILPEMLDSSGNRLIAPYLTRYDGYQSSVPNVCLRVPTGGGKTLLAAASVERLQVDYFKRQTGFVLWVVPSDAIYKQTWKHLANREHPYRQMLERASGGRVKVLEKEDSFNRADFRNHLCVMLLMLQSSARRSKETLRMFKDSGKFMDFFPEVDDSIANRDLLQKVPNLEQNDLIDLGYSEGILPGSVSIKQSLGNTLRLMRPIIVIDEGHKAYSNTARDTLCGFNPSFILELSATPNTNGVHQSNVLVNVPGTDLKDEEMIKLPINVVNIAKGDWKQTLADAHQRVKELTKEAEKVRASEGRYIRPILLVRVERTGKDQRDGRYVHADDAREYLMEKCGVPEEAIRYKTSDKDEIGDEDLLVESCPVQVILTKDALREGWDCPFAYVLAILSKTTANTALTQMIGRVLRQPHAQLTSSDSLNECYVYTFDQVVKQAVDSVRKGLEEEGMGDLSSSVRSLQGGAGTPPKRKVTIERADAFKKLPKILLPRVLRKDRKAKGGYRLLDYDRDILGEVDWESLKFLGADTFTGEAEEKLKRTVARVSIEQRDGHADFTDQLNQDEEGIPEEGLDFPYLVRQLTEIIPNPWQAARILEETIEILRGKMGEEEIYTNRLSLISEMKRDLKIQLYGGTEGKKKITGIAETLFRECLSKGEIEFRLMASNNPDLDWKLQQTLELELTGTEVEFYRKDGSPLQKQVFKRVFEKDLNSLERNVAWHVDGASTVHWWHRIAVNQREYALQGWQKNKVFPDLLVCVHGSKDGKYKLSVLETKGDHLKGNDDTEYKRKLFEILTEHAATSIEAGKLLLGDDTEQMSFTMLLQSNWEQEIAKVI